MPVPDPWRTPLLRCSIKASNPDIGKSPVKLEKSAARHPSCRKTMQRSNQRAGGVAPSVSVADELLSEIRPLFFHTAAACDAVMAVMKACACTDAWLAVTMPAEKSTAALNS